MTKMEWSPQQDAAIKEAQAWLKEKNGSQVFRLFGYAGTGKTTLAREIAGSVKGDVLYGAFTGKASNVMRRKGCSGASTIHSMIYKINDEGTGDQPTFSLNHDSEVSDADLVIIDECSMVDETIGRDLLSFGTKVLVLGDPAQLPPVKGAGFFTEQEPDVMMTEVHRQAIDNPIIQMSMTIREGGQLDIGTYGDSKVILRAALDQAEVLGADQVIVGLNRTRQTYNRRIRELIGRDSDMPVSGDKLVCLRNDRQIGIFNGSLWFVDKCRRSKTNTVNIKITSHPDDSDRIREKAVKVRKEFFLGTEGEIPWQDKRGTQEFTYGYALTCHKSQGSQWNNVMIFDESAAFRDDARRWLYTSITRAAEKLTVVK